jgi:hypothetical protein
MNILVPSLVFATGILLSRFAAGYSWVRSAVIVAIVAVCTSLGVQKITETGLFAKPKPSNKVSFEEAERRFAQWDSEEQRVTKEEDGLAVLSNEEFSAEQEKLLGLFEAYPRLAHDSKIAEKLVFISLRSRRPDILEKVIDENPSILANGVTYADNHALQTWSKCSVAYVLLEYLENPKWKVFYEKLIDQHPEVLTFFPDPTTEFSQRKEFDVSHSVAGISHPSLLDEWYKKHSESKRELPQVVAILKELNSLARNNAKPEQVIKAMFEANKEYFALRTIDGDSFSEYVEWHRKNTDVYRGVAEERLDRLIQQLQQYEFEARKSPQSGIDSDRGKRTPDSTCVPQKIPRKHPVVASRNVQSV